MNSEFLSKEIRFLPQQTVSELGKILQINHSWKDVMGLVPGKPWVPGTVIEGMHYWKKYTSEDICLVADECSRDGRMGFEVLIEEWGTSGRIRPKVMDLIHLLHKAGLERAVLYLERMCAEKNAEECSENTSFTCLKIVGGKTSPCLLGSSADVPVSGDQESAESEDCELANDLCHVSVPMISFKDLLKAVDAGTKIGKGGYGAVYKGCIEIRGRMMDVAIKVLSDPKDTSTEMLQKENVFKNEVEILSKCNHKNILTLEGFACSPAKLGLVYSYMENGSLYDHLTRLNNIPPLPWRQRLRVIEGTAEGIVYLHTNFSPPFIHRDVKSPNILLDRDFVPKLGDFGIVRAGARGLSPATAVQTIPVGTLSYMAPEAIRGDVSVKMDTFSFGIVVLEVLTGLPYFDELRTQRDLLSLVEEFEGDESQLLDSSSEWNVSVGRKLFEFAETCTRDKKHRPNMVHALEDLNAICQEAETLL